MFSSSLGLEPDKSLEDAKYYDKSKSTKRMLNNNQYKKIINCLEKLSNYCDEKGLTSILEGANKNVITSFSMLNFDEEDDKNSKGKDYFVKRLRLMSDYIIEEVAKQKDTDGKTFGEKYWIRSTGPDPHYKGHHALFLVNKRNQEGYENDGSKDDSKKEGNIAKVYKPHDLSADNVVIGKGNMFDQLNGNIDTRNTILEGENSFATMDIDVEHHTEKFVTKKESMTQEEAQKYFFRAGMLKVITDAMAVIDLHCDNIMPTEQGPIIIDAEINFFHYGENSSLVDGNAPGLIADNVGNNKANASFNIIDSVSNTTVPSGYAFNQYEFHCKDRYNEGYNFMLNQLKNKKEEFSTMFYDQLNELPQDTKVRILPLATQKFAEYLSYIIHSNVREGEVADGLIAEIKENLSDEKSNGKRIKFLDSDKIKVTLDDNELKTALLTTFENGTIPAMYADMNGNLYLDEEIVGKIVSKVNDGELKVDGKLNKQQTANMMKDCFVKVLDKMNPPE